MQDHESGSGVLESWGPWQSVMEEAVTGCRAQLRKLDEAVSHGGFRSVDEFHADCMQVYDLANELVERCEDIVRWWAARNGTKAGDPFER